jgi:hypothetical protein
VATEKGAPIHVKERRLSSHEVSGLKVVEGKKERRLPEGRVMHLINSDGMYGAERVLVHLLLTLKEMGVQAAVLKQYQIWSMSREVKALEKRHLNGTKPIDVIPESYLNSF